jgi:hypothetical protein
MTPPERPRNSRSARNSERRFAERRRRRAVTRALPSLLARVGDPAPPDGDLAPVERTAREWRQEVIDDLGGLESGRIVKKH